MDKLNIIFTGNVHVEHSSENSVVRQLIREGHKVTKFIYPTIKHTDYNQLNNKLFETIEKNKFDLLISGKCMGLNKENMNNIKIPKVSWVFDLFKGYEEWNRSEWYEAQIPAWDCCFGAEGGQIEYYREKSINYHHLKAGADPAWHKKIPFDKDYNEIKCDVSFLGGIYNPLRMNMQSQIQCMPNINYRNFVGYELNNQIIPGIFMDDMSHFANVCKITIGCNYRNDIEGYWSKRPYELMGSNNFMIQAFVKGMELEGFKHKKNTVFFYNDNFEEMKQLIEYYIREENQDELNKIKETGYQLIHHQHMMKHRTKEFFRILKKQNII